MDRLFPVFNKAGDFIFSASLLFFQGPHLMSGRGLARALGKEQPVDIQDYIVKTSITEWSPLEEAGVDCTGINWMPLRWKENRPVSFLLRFDPEASYPYHSHPAGEEILVLEGSCVLENCTFNMGDYLYTPPNFKHSVKTERGCTLFLSVPEEVEILR